MSSTVVVVTICIYVAILFVAAWLPARHADNDTFFTGNRRTSWYMAALAMIGAAMSGVTFISVPASVATDSFSYMQMVAGFTVGQMVVAFLLIPLFYRLRVVSIYEYFRSRFGTNSHKAGSSIFLIAKILNAAIKIYVVCIITQHLLFEGWGIPLWANIALTVTLVWLYTARGGVRSLIWTDTLHTLCLVAGVVLSGWFIIDGLGWSFGEAITNIQSSRYSQIIFLDDSSSDRYFWKIFFAGIFTLIAMSGLDQDMMQRNLSCRSKGEAQINIVITAICQAVVILMLLALGALLYIYATERNIPLTHSSDALFSEIAINGGLPTAAGVVFILALVASTWSSAGSSLTALTTSFTLDILGYNHISNSRILSRRRHIVHALLSLLLMVVVIIFGQAANDSAINLVFRVVSYAYGPILGMFTFGIFTKRRLHDRMIWIISLASPMICALVQWWCASQYGYHIGFELLIYNALLTMLGMLIASKRGSNTNLAR